MHRTRRWTWIVLPIVLVAPLLAGCGDTAKEGPPAELPPAPQDASKASYGAFKATSKAATSKPAAPK